MQQEVVIEPQGSVLRGMLWMFLVSILLFWLPGLGSLIAGIVGGVKAGGVGNALVAAIIPGLMLGVAFFFLASALTGMPLIGIIAAMGSFVMALFGLGPLLIGALIGGIMA